MSINTFTILKTIITFILVLILVLLAPLSYGYLQSFCLQQFRPEYSAALLRLQYSTATVREQLLNTGVGTAVNQSDVPFIFLEDKFQKDPVPVWHGVILLSYNMRSTDNLQRIFEHYTKTHPNKNERLELSVFLCNEADIKTIPLGEVLAPINPSSSRKRRSMFYALFYRTGNSVTSAGGENEWYSYVVGVTGVTDVSTPGETKTVVLRGRSPFAPKNYLRTERFSNKSFDVKVELYYLIGVSPSKVYYTFSNIDSMGNESEVMTVQQAELSRPLSAHIQFVAENIGYIFMGSKYSITTDGGKTWTGWDAEKDLSEWQCCDRSSIQEIRVSPDGTGEMKVVLSKARTITVHTEDFGKRWTSR